MRCHLDVRKQTLEGVFVRTPANDVNHDGRSIFYPPLSLDHHSFITILLGIKHDKII